MKQFILMILTCWAAIGWSADLTITLPADRFQTDDSLKIIVSQLPDIEDYANLNGYEKVYLIAGNAAYQFAIRPDQLTFDQSYELKKGDQIFRLFLTRLPIITIDTYEPIVDEPKRLASFSYADDSQVVESFIGIELRGGFSQTFPKKTYDLELWEDQTGEDTDKLQLGDLREDDDWILDGIYNEPLRIRSYISHKLWLQMHQPHYLDEEPEAKSGADVNFVEMFLDGRYNGVYLLSEQVDKKQLQIKSYNGEVRGELIKGSYWGATTFTELPTYDNNSREWGGFEMKYPDEDEITDWRALHSFADFIINGSDENFIDEVWNKFEMENAMDYYLYMNLLRAYDNRGKNIYIARYRENRPYFYVPWDLDATWGMSWDGTRDESIHGILSNGLYDRALYLNPNDYKPKVQQLWKEYRSDLLSNESLAGIFNTTYDLLKDNNVYEREALVYPNYTFDTTLLTYALDWIEDRLTYLDSELDIVLNTNYLNQLSLNVYPNPADEFLFVEYYRKAPFKILDLNGRIVKEGEVNGSTLLDLSDLDAGMYFLSAGGQVGKVVVR